MLATHDSLTGHKLKTWWLYPFLFTAKCQNKTIEEQLEIGVRYFDLRFREYKGKLYAAHGVIIFNITLEQVIHILKTFTDRTKETVYFRILFENALVKDSINYDQFKELVLSKLDTSNYLKLHCIGNKKTWDLTYYLDIPFYGKNDYYICNKDISKKIDEIYNSIDRTDLSVYECYTYKGIKRLFGLPYPKLAANKINKHIKQSSNFTMIDFI